MIEKETIQYKYWSEIESIGQYKSVLKNTRILFSDVIKNHIQLDEDCTLHELGCNVGSNLKILADIYENMETTGNDIGKEAIKNAHHHERVKIYEKDTVEYLKEMKPVDYMITMAHLIHLPNTCDKELKKWIPLKCKKKLIIYEQNLVAPKKIRIPPRGERIFFDAGYKKKDKFMIKFARNYDTFFDLQLVEKRGTGSSYQIWVYENTNCYDRPLVL